MKIAIVDDDLMIADFLEEVLQDLGHEVCGIARNVTEGVNLLRLHRPDVTVIDMQLGREESGTEIIDQLARTCDLGRMGILYVSGQACRVHNEARHGHACLSKPYSILSLEHSLSIVWDLARGYVPSQVMPRELGLLHNLAV
jgi:DNA-binding response OmpR family regulator